MLFFPKETLKHYPGDLFKIFEHQATHIQKRTQCFLDYLNIVSYILKVITIISFYEETTPSKNLLNFQDSIHIKNLHIFLKYFHLLINNSQPI